LGFGAGQIAFWGALGWLMGSDLENFRPRVAFDVALGLLFRQC